MRFRRDFLPISTTPIKALQIPRSHFKPLTVRYGLISTLGKGKQVAHGTVSIGIASRPMIRWNRYSPDVVWLHKSVSTAPGVIGIDIDNVG